MKTHLKSTRPVLGLLLALAASEILPAQQQQPLQPQQPQTQQQQQPQVEPPLTEERSASPGRPGTMTQEQRGQFSAEDFRLIKEVAQSGILEVQAGEIARSQASNQKVKDFAQRMAAEHGQSVQELRQIARDKGATLPATLTEKQERTIERLRKASGQEFDQLYTQHLVDSHEEELKLLRRTADKAEDAELKSFAQRQASTIEQHLQATKDLQKEIKQ